MEFFHRRLGIIHNFVHRLHHAVRRQTTVLHAQIHAAAGGVKTDTQGIGRSKLHIKEPVAPSFRKYIVMIKAGSTSCFQQLSYSG